METRLNFREEKTINVLEGNSSFFLDFIIQYSSGRESTYFLLKNINRTFYFTDILNQTNNIFNRAQTNK